MHCEQVDKVTTRFWLRDRFSFGADSVTQTPADPDWNDLFAEMVAFQFRLPLHVIDLRS